MPAADNQYSLGTALFRWKSLQLGPGTLFIQDQITGDQVGLTVIDGALLLDGADSLRIGNTRLTATGLASVLSDADITIGAYGDTGFALFPTGIKFSDGTVMTTAMMRGPAGPAGTAGPIGPQGPAGPAGEPGAPLRTNVPESGTKLDFKDQVFVLTRGSWILPDASEGQVIYLVMSADQEVRGIEVVVEHLRIIGGERSAIVRDATWIPFIDTAGVNMESMVTAVFVEGAWSVSSGTLPR